jgi:hypothetical protein
MTRAARQLMAVVAVAAALLLGLGNVALAHHVPALLEVRVTPNAKPQLGYVVTAHVHTADNRPVNETTVRFYEVVDFFGEREELLGSAITDGQGNASLPYQPAVTGSHQVIAHSLESSSFRIENDQVLYDQHFGDAEGRTTFVATVIAAAYQPVTVPLADFSKVVTAVVGGVVLAVWALIAFAFFSTARGVRRGARDLGSKGDHA